jgi:DNA polymerase I-like protein with 3'-5' exonuclease and polymerase domains
MNYIADSNGNPIEKTYRFTTIAELTTIIDKSKPLMVDTETIGLYGKIRLFQCYQRGWETALFVEYPQPFDLVALLSGLLCVFHNSHYDITCVQEGLGKQVWMPNEFHDTFLLARLHFYQEEKFSLDDVVKYCLGFDVYNGTKKDMHEADWSVPVLPEENLIYAAKDVIYLHDVWDKVEYRRDDISYKLDMLCTRYCLDFQNNGMPIDIQKLNERYAKNCLEIKEIGLPINSNSYVQVRKYIDSVMSDDIGLSTLAAQGNTKAKAVKDTRKLVKNNSFLTKFTNTMAEMGNGFGVIYGKFKCSPRSGRTASDDQNLQQIPRSLKTIFGVAVDGDEVIIYSDFAQIQLRGVCVVTGDRVMEKLFRQGRDLHTYVAEMIFGPNYTKEHRQITKTANFGLLFGAGVIVFINILVKQAGLLLSEDAANTIKKKWIGLWKQIDEWQSNGIKSWKKGEAWETPLGRRYRARMMTDQLAMQIQGFEAEVAKIAMHYMWPELKALHPDIKLRNFMHDSYLFTCPNNPEIYKAACQVVADKMQEAWREMCKSVLITDLPMPVKVRVGWNWGDMEGDDEAGWIYELKVA